MQRTQNYNLCQWEAEDRILRSDFNSNNAKIDAALAAGAKIATGSYTGTGEYGASHPNTLTFDFAPKVVIISLSTYDGNINAQIVPMIGVRGVNCTYRQVEKYYLTMWTFSGNSVSWYASGNDGAYAQMNTNGKGNIIVD